MNYFEIVVRYARDMPPTTLRLVEMELKEYAEKFTPKPIIRLEKEKL